MQSARDWLISLTLVRSLRTELEMVLKRSLFCSLTRMLVAT
jgi:hypothetical protein